MREAAISYINNGGNKTDAAGLFKISRARLYRWLEMDDLRPKAHGERKIDKAALKKDVQDHPDRYFHERAARFDVGISGMHYALKRLGIVEKRAAV